MGLPEYPTLISYLPLAHIYGVSKTIDFPYMMILTKYASDSANLVSLPSADGLVISQEIRCVSLKMPKF